MRGWALVAAISIAAMCGLFGFVLGALHPVALSRSAPEWEFADAARTGDIKKMEKLCAGGVDVNAIPFDERSGASGIPPIMVAVLYGKPKAVDWLLRNGADVNVTLGPDTPLRIAEGHFQDTQKTLDILRAHNARHWDEPDAVK